MWQQWRKASNYIQSVQTYEDMSPDLAMRHRVNQSLRQRRQPLSLEAWCDECDRIAPSEKRTLLFLHRTLASYSGLEFALVRPHDRLVEDLQFPLVCWFDWSASFCDDVATHFGIDISDCFDETSLHTLADVIVFLQTRLGNNR